MKRPKYQYNQESHNFKFKGNKYNILSPEGERMIYISGSKIAEHNSKYLSSVKPYNDIDIYVNTKRKSI